MTRLGSLIVSVSVMLSVGGCRNSEVGVLRNYPSPDGRWTATVFYYDPGAMGAAGTVVYLLPKDVHQRDASDNILILPNRYEVIPQWVSLTELQIGCTSCPLERAELVVVKKGAVAIRYKQTGND